MNHPHWDEVSTSNHIPDPASFISTLHGNPKKGPPARMRLQCQSQANYGLVE